MSRIVYKVTLSIEEHDILKDVLKSTKSSKLTRRRAQILLGVDDSIAPIMSDGQVAKLLRVRGSTVAQARRIFVLEGFEAALYGHPREQPPSQPKIDGELEARLTLLACSPPPAGYCGWSIRLLADKFVELHYPAGVSRETVRKALKKTSSSLGRRSIS